ncbi:MAG: NAD(P)-binding protein, partial [Thiotrichaceae bacterium]|nr:NAD(P)-binding protein [Thiotrichaceae bacterium]
MGKITGFKEFERKDETYQSVKKRIGDYNEFTIPLKKAELTEQGSRCMDCGIPFCHSACPLGNLIPDFNDMVHRDEWKKASWILHTTNNFPEFTGRICNAPCEPACTLSIRSRPVTIRSIELAIVERAWQEGWSKPRRSRNRLFKRVAIIGSGPAGLACAQQLVRAGYRVTVFEKADRLGGLLRYGIPDFRLEKPVLERRLAQLRDEGVRFRTGIHVGLNLDIEELRRTSHAVVLACGSEQ